MAIEYIIFFLFFSRSLFKLVNKHLFNGKLKIPVFMRIEESKESSVSKGAASLCAAALLCFGAYCYADLPWLWLTLSVIYIFFGLILFVVFLISSGIKKSDPDSYNKNVKEYAQNSNDTNNWPRWKIHSHFVLNTAILLAWLYSWRHLIA